MLPIISKHLTAQIITTTTLITIMLLSSYCSTTESLPITSKPIESTAENLAWEAWLMVPVGQQQKSRKVTPKSIFIVPQKKNQTSFPQCPPGEHLFESRCIPTVNIDTEQILLTQLTNLVLSSGDYDYDYDEDGNDAPGAEKLEGGLDIIPSSNADKADEPLKFDIFRDNFPIGSSGSGDSSGSKDTEDENVFFISERRRRPPLHTAIPDLDTDSSSYASHNQSFEDDVKDVDEEPQLFLSGIDAILVPAVSENQGSDQKLNFSIYPDVANTTIEDNEMDFLTAIGEKKADLEDTLEEESFFLDNNHKVAEKDITTTERSDTTTDQVEVETTTLKLVEDDEVESKTEFTRSVTEVVPVEGETTISETESTEITSTLVTEEDDSTSTMIPNEEATTITDEITTMTNSKEETTIINSELHPQSSTNIVISGDLKDRSAITTPPEADTNPPSDNRFIYHRLSDKTIPPPVIDISAELKMINDLVARNRQPSTTKTPSTPSVESASKSNDRWSKIIPSPNSIATTSVVPVQLSSSSSNKTNSTSSNILNSSSSSSTTSSTDSQGSQGSSFDPSSPTSSTSPTPEISKSDSLWWLPTGWRVDRPDVDRPLLLRFWSALSGISGSQTKV